MLKLNNWRGMGRVESSQPPRSLVLLFFSFLFFVVLFLIIFSRVRVVLVSFRRLARSKPIVEEGR